MSDEKITYGKFVTKKKTRPAIVVDCSGWADPADGPITYGKFVTKKKTRPAIVSKLHLAMLKLRVKTAGCGTAEQLLDVTKRLIEALAAADPDLNLEYDPTQSGLAKDSEGATVAEVVLVPRTAPLDIDDRLAALMAKAREVSSANEAELVEV